MSITGTSAAATAGDGGEGGGAAAYAGVVVSATVEPGQIGLFTAVGAADDFSATGAFSGLYASYGGGTWIGYLWVDDADQGGTVSLSAEGQITLVVADLGVHLA